jgi:tetratricopeptide (TPR) repeat protein
LFKLSIEKAVRQKDWTIGAWAAFNISLVLLQAGNLLEAKKYAVQSVQLADLSRKSDERIDERTVLAEILHQTGYLSEAAATFRKAEAIQKRRDPTKPTLYSCGGFWYCDLLLEQGKKTARENIELPHAWPEDDDKIAQITPKRLLTKCNPMVEVFRNVQLRALQSLKWVTNQGWIISIALDYLTLGRVFILQAIFGKPLSWEKAQSHLDEAVDGLRKSGNQDEIPRGLLARAELYRYQRSYEKAWVDLEEAKEIAERGQMNLYLADYHLESARLCLAENAHSEYRISNTECRTTKFNEARQHYEEAAKRVQDMGYHRRDPEVLLIQAELEMADGKKAAARKTLETAERRIDEMGCHRWDIEVERLQGKL